MLTLITLAGDLDFSEDKTSLLTFSPFKIHLKCHFHITAAADGNTIVPVKPTPMINSRQIFSATKLGPLAGLLGSASVRYVLQDCVAGPDKLHQKAMAKSTAISLVCLLIRLMNNWFASACIKATLITTVCCQNMYKLYVCS